jgi:23S rRNA pseudouridine2457 synthase
MLRYFLFHKPYQVLSQFSPEDNKKTLADFLPDFPKDCYPVGRLDYDSEGLLLLSNDKALIHRLLEPRFGHARSYWAQVEGAASDAALQPLLQGITIRIDGKAHDCKPLLARVLKDVPTTTERHPPIRYRKDIPTSWLDLTLTEGKNRQVRRMTAAIGFPTLRLIRHAIGRIELGNLAPGALMELPAYMKGRLLQTLD